VPVDVVEPVDPSVWALGAALHDTVHALHPALSGWTHGRASEQMLRFAEQTIAVVTAPVLLHEAVTRHTFFARAFELSRVDVLVSWWTGSRRFFGRRPPARLLAWPELRRVRIEPATLHLAQLADQRTAAEKAHLSTVLGAWLSRTPLTDLATAGREFPSFRWTGAALGLFETPTGRTLGLRALDLSPPPLVDRALGRSIRPYSRTAGGEDLRRIAAVLTERALAAAVRGMPLGTTLVEGDVVDEDARYARALGATLALHDLGRYGLAEERRSRVEAALRVAASAVNAIEVEALAQSVLRG
jgi:hypothetical protein